jgi:stage II sporulation protein M
MLRTSLEEIKKNKNFIFFALFICAGVIIGVTLICLNDKAFIDNLSFITQGFLRTRANQPVGITLLNSFYSTFAIVFLMFLFGFSSIAQPLTVSLLVFRGLGFGICTGYLYLFYGFKGAIYSTIIILPPFLLTSLCLILASICSIKMSNHFFSTFYKKLNLEMRPDKVKSYCLKFLLFSVFILLVSCLESGLVFVFARFFKF